MTTHALSVAGHSVRRLDAVEKVMGRATFAGDIQFPRMLHATVVRSPFAHARIRHIDVARARSVPGVRAIVTGADVPFRYNLPLRDQPFMAIDRVRYVGEPVVAIAADDADAAREAAALVDVEYEELPAVLDPRESMQPGAPRIHPDFDLYRRDATLFTPIPDSNVLSHFKLRRGDVEAGLRQADEIFEGTYTSHAFSHAAIEPHVAVAQYERTGQLTLWTTAQSPWFTANDLATAMGWPVHRVRIVAPYLGGGFGGKHGIKIEPAVVALALKTDGRPVRLVLSREEVFTSTSVRGAVEVKLQSGVMRDGTLVARRAELVWDTGAYADVGPLLCRNASLAATGPHRIPNQSIDGYCVYTNKFVTGAFRGYGIMEMSFAYESQMDEIAQGLGIDPVELRRRNLLEDGEETATGERLQAVGLKATLDACVREMAWDRPKAPGTGRSIVTTAKSSVAPSGSSAVIQMNDDGTLTLLCSTTEMGQGSRTVMTQLAAEGLGARLEDMAILASDTAFTPPDRSTSSSRSTFNMGNAILLAAADTKRLILEKASEFLEADPDELEAGDSRVFVRGAPARSCTFAEVAATRPGTAYGPIVGRGSYVPGGTTTMDLETGHAPRVIAFWLYSSQGVEVEVDTETGRVSVLRVVSVHDTGRTLNPVACAAQTEGGVAIATSAALMEHVVLDADGNVVNPSFRDYQMATSCDVPPITPIMVEIPHPEGPLGAKGMGEGPTTGIAAAIANAVFDAVGVRITDLPITPEKVLRGLDELRSAA
jgi:CO/xanthine dehydrogenase Mo-binding subunit